jgi:hypothetical protein
VNDIQRPAIYILSDRFPQLNNHQTGAHEETLVREIGFGFDFGRLSRAVKQDWLWFAFLLWSFRRTVVKNVLLFVE